MYLCSSLIDNASFDAALGEPGGHHETCGSGSDNQDIDMICLCTTSHSCG